MVINESSRHAMYSRLQEIMGEEHATSLMEHLPPVGWADVATKHDLGALRSATKQDLGALRVDLNTLRVDLDAFRVATKQDLDALQTYLELRIESSGNKLKADLLEMMNAQTRTLVTWLLVAMTGSTLTVGALAFGAAQLV